MATMNWNSISPYINARFLNDFFEQLPKERIVQLDNEHQWVTHIQCGTWRIEQKSGSDLFRLADHTNRRCIYERETTLYIAIKKHIAPKMQGNANRKLALVLAGGGAKGAYQIGVWNALRKLDVAKHIEGISGTSIGAVNALLIAKGDYDYAEAAWSRLSSSEFRAQNRERIKKIINEPFAPLRSLTEEVFVSQAELRNELFHAIGGGQTERITQKFRIFSTVTALAKDGSPQQFPTYLPWNGLRGYDIVNVIMASAALPLLYDPIEISGKQYCDGGIRDNVPIEPLYRCGYRNFIVVHLKQDGPETNRVRKQMAQYKDCRAVHIIPGAGFKDDLFAMLELTPDTTRERIRLGREDAMSLRGNLTNLIPV